VARRGSSDRWLRRQRRDPYVARSRDEGYRSRATYKLQEIDASQKLLRPGMVVVDLGAAPGGFSQYAAQRVGEKGRVVALDLLPMDPIGGVDILQGDFTTEATLETLREMLGERAVDLVISDMAPNITGNSAVDQPRGMLLAEMALEFAREQLKPGGGLVVKLFQGEGFEAFVTDARSSFRRVRTVKPAASRSASREMYLLARQLQM
jgi:23S rRNA (uridine2552-2'-O)-methyltransferase